jgi:integrase
MSSLEAWPPTVASLGGWITLRVTGSSLQEFTQIKPQTVETYLSSVRSYCVDRNWDTSIFHNDHIRRLLKGAKSLYRSTKRDRPPITLDHLHALTSSPCYTAADSNLRAAYLTAFFGFLRAGEFTWDQRQYADPRIFHATKATRGDVQFAPNFESLTLTLKSSKTDVEHTGVRIVIAASKDPTFCPVWAMRALFQMDPQPPNAPLFNLGAGKAFTKKAFRTAMSKRLLETGYNPRNLTGHSFRRGAAQHASDLGMLHHEIQLLGRWSSDAFKLYFTATPRQRLLLQRQLHAMAPPSYTTDTFPTLAPPLPLA